MKKIVLLALSVFAVAPAFADVDTICLGGGPKGDRYQVSLKQVDSRIGSASDAATMNGFKTQSTLIASKGEVATFSLQGNGIVFTLDYNQGDATAKLTGQGLNVPMFCSRY